MKARAEYKKKIESRSAGILGNLKARTRAQWTFWQATGQECYYIEFAPGTPEEIVKKAMDGMIKAFRAANVVSLRKATIVITPKCA